MLKRVAILFVVALVMIVATACSGKSTPAPAPTKAPAAQEAPADASAGLSAALDAAQNKDWAAVETNLKAALAASTDSQQQAVIQKMLDDLGQKKYDKVTEDLLEETLGGGEESGGGEGSESGEGN